MDRRSLMARAAAWFGAALLPWRPAEAKPRATHPPVLPPAAPEPVLQAGDSLEGTFFLGLLTRREDGTLAEVTGPNYHRQPFRGVIWPADGLLEVATPVEFTGMAVNEGLHGFRAFADDGQPIATTDLMGRTTAGLRVEPVSDRRLTVMIRGCAFGKGWKASTPWRSPDA